MKRYLLDADVVVQFLTAQSEKRHEAARDLFQSAIEGRCILIVEALVIGEVVATLTGAAGYGLKRKPVADTLAKFIVQAGISCPDQSCIADALKRYKASSVKFSECYLAAAASERKYSIASFEIDAEAHNDVLLWDSGAP